MNRFTPRQRTLFMAIAAIITGTVAPAVTATEPCGDFGECKALIEVNSTDGDIGFHFLMDGDDLNSARIYDPNGVKVFQDFAKGPLMEQKLTETFAESAEPLCWPDPEADEDEDIVPLEDFLDLWAEGTYFFTGSGDDGEKSAGETELTYQMPAAPVDLDFDGMVITWDTGDDLGNCADSARLDGLVGEGILSVHPEDVTVDEWEVVLEPDVDDGAPLGSLKFTIRVAGDISPLAVTVPLEYLAYFEDDTPGKIEVGAIGGEDNGTFTEIEVCINENEGCEEED